MGLVALKNLLEEGFEAVGLERNEYLGGLWKYTEKPTISVLKSGLELDPLCLVAAQVPRL